MSRTASYWYCDRRTFAPSVDPPDYVLLVGSYLGYANFGDVLQLKGAIRWHRQQTGLEPVLVCEAPAIRDASFIDRLRAWFGLTHVLVHSRERVDFGPVGLSEVIEAPPITHLHVYGGGFLNGKWGPYLLGLIESLHERFGVAHYVLSGQQVGPEIRSQLAEHFARFRPVLAGGRDPESAALLSECGVPSGYSFDDAIEPLQELAESIRPTGEDSGEAVDVLIHMNLAAYAWETQGPVTFEYMAAELARLREYVVRVRGGREPAVALLHAYNDRRVDEVIDTLAAVQQLEDTFPFCHYRVIDLSRLALEMGTGREGAARIPGKPLVALSSSYHVALFCGLLGVPCFLQSHNAYYRQKKLGLGLRADSLADFLDRPEVPSLLEKLRARDEWLARKKAAYQLKSPTKHPVLPAKSKHAPSKPWTPKPWAGTLRAELERLAQGWLQQDAYIKDQRAYIHQLEQERDRLWGEVWRIGRSWEEQKAYIARLEQERDRLWSEVQRVSRSWEEQRSSIESQRTYIAQLEQERDKLWAEVRRMGRVWQEQHDHTKTLEQERDKLWAEVQRLGRAWQEQHDYTKTLEQERDKLWAEVQRLGRAWQEQHDYTKTLEQERDKLWAEVQQLGPALEEQKAYIEQQEARLAQAEKERDAMISVPTARRVLAGLKRFWSGIWGGILLERHRR